MKSLLKIAVCLTLAISPFEAKIQAAVRLPRLISDGMVLQRDQQIRIWGWADPEEKITVTMPSQSGKTPASYLTTADASGTWEVSVPAHAAGGPYIIQINDITISNVLFGDVWICSGQSNMELPMSRCADLYAAQIAAADCPQIRQFKVNTDYYFHGPRQDVQSGTWQSANSQTVPEFSAVAWFFACELYNKYHIPIGLINSSVGGSPAQAWVSDKALAKFPEYLAQAKQCSVDAYVDSVKASDKKRSDTWYYTMNAADPGVKAKWFLPSADDSKYQPMTLPGYWGDQGIAWQNGSVWLRKHVTLTAAQAAGTATLRMGCIVDGDETYVNGKFVGNVTYRYPPRIYPVPAGTLREGDNVIAVRIICNGGNGGVVEDKRICLVTQRDTVDLSGKWLFRGGAVMPALESQTFFNYTPTGLYNAMIEPMMRYAVKGAIWYQGEANTWRPAEYSRLMASLIEDWREGWHSPKMPFIYVQLANFMRSYPYPTQSSWAELRDAQRRTLEVPYTGMAVTIDIGEWNDIHPLDKKDVGVRLALEAQRVAYGQTKIVSRGPMYKAMKVTDGKAVLTFDTQGSALKADGPLRRFAIAGSDHRWFWADAVITGSNTITVSSKDVPAPIVVHYGWADNPEGANLRNEAGLPASPFTTE